MKTYVLHYKPLVERRKHIDEQLLKQNIDAIFIESEVGPGLYVDLQNSSSSLIKKHILAWLAISNGSEPYGLILEDDVILADDFSSKLDHYISQLPPDFDMLFVGNGLSDNYHLNIPAGTVGIRTPYTDNPPYNGITRCTDSYVLSKACAYRMLQYLHAIPIINLPIDHWMNKIAYDMNFSKVYWAEPTIVSQGSETGLFNSCVLR
jgi:GR25 family glycosyltransferase involved in LPS biosynthesis